MRRNCTISTLTITALAVLLPVSALAQKSKSSEGGEPKFEFGVGVMGSFYDSKSFTGPGGSAKGGFASGLGGSIWLGQNMYRRIGGELRYDFALNDMTLESGSTKVAFGGKTHAFHYDMHFHLTDRGGKIRPYALVGVGAKFFEGNGVERAFQPLQTVAVLSQGTQITPLVTVGGGVKFQLTNKVNMRLEFRNNMTPFPKKLIAATRSTGGNGWTNNLLPTVGISLLF